MRKTLRILSFSLILFVAFSCKKDDNAVIDPDIEPHDFLSDEQYSSLVVEIVYVEGYEPNEGAVNFLENFLENRLYKPSGISFVQTEISSPGKSSYDVSSIREVEHEYREMKTKNNKLTAFFFYADEGFQDDTEESKTLGVAYGPTSMTIFKKAIDDFSGGLGQPSETVLESTILTHEFAHILGLVNNGTPMQNNHQDDAHGKHCDVEDCLMYYLAETDEVVGNLIGGDALELDAQCIEDLQANGGK